MKGIVNIVYILSVIDMLLTYIGIKTGFIEEANPLLADLFHKMPELALFILFAFVSGMAWIVYKFGCRLRYIYTGLVLTVAVKSVVVGMHAQWIMLAMGQ